MYDARNFILETVYLIPLVEAKAHSYY